MEPDPDALMLAWLRTLVVMPPGHYQFINQTNGPSMPVTVGAVVVETMRTVLARDLPNADVRILTRRHMMETDGDNDMVDVFVEWCGWTQG